MSYYPPRKDRVVTAPSVALPQGKEFRIWAGQVTSSSDGSWKLDVDAADFTQVISVVATAQSNETSINSIPIATVRTYTSTQVTGWVLRPASGGIFLGGVWNGAAFMTTPTRIFVQVVGF
jgi:hypothetical protein